MSLVEIFKEAISKPFDRPNDILVGMVMVMASILLIPIFTLYGYFMEVVRSIAQDGEVPRPGNYLRLTINGLKLFLVMLPLTVISMASYLPLSFGLIESTALSIVAGLVYALTGYIGFAIALKYMVKGDWRSAYSISSVRMAFSLDYVKYVLAFAVAYYAMAIVVTIVSLLSFITIVGWLLVIPAASFYILVFAAIFMGRIYELLDEID